jgi:hypothetical protein
VFELGSMGQFVDVDSGIDSGLTKSLSLLFLHHSHEFIINIKYYFLLINIILKFPSLISQLSPSSSPSIFSLIP